MSSMACSVVVQYWLPMSQPSRRSGVYIGVPSTGSDHCLGLEASLVESWRLEQK